MLNFLRNYSTQIENGGFYIDDFFTEPPFANINSSPINHLVQCMYMYISVHVCVYVCAGADLGLNF